MCELLKEMNSDFNMLSLGHLKIYPSGNAKQISYLGQRAYRFGSLIYESDS